MKHLHKGTQVLAGVSNNCFETSISLAGEFSECGVNAVVAHLPSYFPLSADQMQKYFETLADKSPLPVIIYNILSTTHMSIPLDVVEKLSHHQNIAGIKDSERDLDRMKQLAKMFSGRPDFCIMCGWTLQSYATLSMGFDGIVPNPANADPQLFQDLYNFMVTGNRPEAEKLQKKVDEMAAIFQKDRILSSILAA